MDIILIIIGVILILGGLAGCIIPIIPGPPFSFLGLILLHLTSNYHFSERFLWIWGGLTVLVTVLDYFIPIWGTQKFGGTRKGIWGATIGLVLGLFFFPPIGIILGPFIGAIVGELTQSEDMNKAFKSGLGSLVGFLFGTGLKFVVSGGILYYFFKELIKPEWNLV